MKYDIVDDLCCDVGQTNGLTNGRSDLNCKTYNHVAVVGNKCKPSSFIGKHLVKFIRSLSN